MNILFGANNTIRYGSHNCIAVYQCLHMICVPTLDVRMPRGRNQNHFSHCNRKAFVVTNLLRVFVLNLDNMAILSADTPHPFVSMGIFLSHRCI